MFTPILTTKLYTPPARPNVVLRSRLFERLDAGLSRKLTLISAPAGFGKTTLVSNWVAGCGRPTAWVSLDEADNDATRFLTYLVAALRTVAGDIGEGLLSALQSSPPPPPEFILTTLLNELATLSANFVLVLDDYHVIQAPQVDVALTFLLEHLPPQLHLVLATREDPDLPLARLRVRNQLNELRVTDLRFTLAEATAFLKHAMGLNLAAAEVAALETRTEGWIAGLQLAAISMQGHKDSTDFIKSFTGSHHFVLDYLVEEVLGQQPPAIQTFLLHTSILERFCGSLCAALLPEDLVNAQETLEYIERANLFIVPLDNERRWYRYHHLFADLLRQRLPQHLASATQLRPTLAILHKRASFWFEENGLEIEAFGHAVAANDIEHAASLVEGKGMPLHFRGGALPVLNWLESLANPVLDGRPSLWVMYASILLWVGNISGVEAKLEAAETALQNVSLDPVTHDLLGHIASIRATLAIIRQQPEVILAQSQRALEYLHPDNLPVRTATTWALGFAYQLQGDRPAAGRAYTEALNISRAIGHNIISITAAIGLASIQELENQLYLAADTYRQALQAAGESPMPVVCAAYLGLARIYYEWNDLATAQQYGQQGLQMARQLESSDIFALLQIFMARLQLAQGNISGAITALAEAEQFARQHNFVTRLPDIADVQVRILLAEGKVSAAAELARSAKPSLSLARVELAQRGFAADLPLLSQLRQEAEAKNWPDEQLKVLVLQASSLYLYGKGTFAFQLLEQALRLAEPGGFIRTFLDEGSPMKQLLTHFATRYPVTDYLAKLLAAFGIITSSSVPGTLSPLAEPLSSRELEVLRLIAQGFSNQEICDRLFLALNSVKGHNRRIFSKLAVHSRTEAIARAHELGLL